MTVHVGVGPSKRRNRLYNTIADCGAVPYASSTADQVPAIQRAVERARSAKGRGRGVVFIPNERWECASTLELPEEPPITFRGTGEADDGAAPSILYWLGDLGDGVPAITGPASVGPHTFDWLAISGPRANTLPHDPPAAMNCIETEGKLRLIDANILGFRAPVSILNPELVVRRSFLLGNQYGVELAAGTTRGLMLLDRVALDAQSTAGILIDPDATAQNMTMIQCHLGQGSSFCFYRPGSGDPAQEVMIDGLVVIQSSFESPAMGVARGRGTVQNLLFFGNPEANIMGAVNDPAFTRTANWDVDKIRNFNSQILVPLSESTYPMFRADRIENVWLADPQYYLSDVAAQVTYPAGKMQLNDGGTMEAVRVGAMPEAGSQETRGWIASDDIEQWDLVQRDGSGTVKTHTGSVAAKVEGVALRDAEAGDVVDAWRSGRFNNCQVKIASGRTVNQWKLLKADPSNPGCVMEATSVADANIVGQSYWSGTGPTTIDAKLRLR